MKFWQSVSFTETEQVVGVARIAEELGFHGVMVSDHLFYPEKLRSKYPYSPDGRPGFEAETEWPEPWALLGAIAQATARVRMTTGVYILPLRHPLEVARAISTLAVLSRGRLALGVGVGWMREEFEQLGREFGDRGRRTDEAIRVLRAVSAGGMVEFHGEFYDFERLQMSPVAQEPVPIYVGGATAAALRRAGRLGDGWIGAGSDLPTALAMLGEIARHRREAGRERTPFEAIVPLTDPPSADAYRRLEDAGGTSTVHYPLAFTLGPRSSLEAKRRAMERYANDVIAKLR
jgi:probable F420-dependent oxidoreductase